MASPQKLTAKGHGQQKQSPLAFLMPKSPKPKAIQIVLQCKNKNVSTTAVDFKTHLQTIISGLPTPQNCIKFHVDKDRFRTIQNLIHHVFF